MSIVYFTVAGNDLSSHMQYNDYEMNEEQEYSSWTDANYEIHRTLKRTRIEGEFELVFFSTQVESLDWFNNILSAVTTDGRVAVGVYVQNINEFKEITAHVDVTMNNQFMVGDLRGDIVKVKIEEV